MGLDLAALADRLIDAYDAVTTLPPLTESAPELGVVDAYGVLAIIEERRRAQGWRAVGRKIGFTNRTIWERYGVRRPMWAHVWSHTVHHAVDGRATLSLRPFVQPRVEPEVAFLLRDAVPVSGDAEEILRSVAFMAPSFEIVQSHYPDWRFQSADCTAAFGLHGAVVLGAPVAVTDANRAAIAAALPSLRVRLARNGVAVDEGVGANVLDSPALALGHLARVLAEQPQFPPLAAGEIVTTGTITDAWPPAPGDVFTSEYGGLGLEGLTLTLTP